MFVPPVDPVFTVVRTAVQSVWPRSPAQPVPTRSTARSVRCRTLTHQATHARIYNTIKPLKMVLLEDALEYDLEFVRQANSVVLT